MGPQTVQEPRTTTSPSSLMQFVVSHPIKFFLFTIVNPIYSSSDHCKTEEQVYHPCTNTSRAFN